MYYKQIEPVQITIRSLHTSLQLLRGSWLHHCDSERHRRCRGAQRLTSVTMLQQLLRPPAANHRPTDRPTSPAPPRSLSVGPEASHHRLASSRRWGAPRSARLLAWHLSVRSKYSLRVTSGLLSSSINCCNYNARRATVFCHTVAANRHMMLLPTENLG